VEKKNTGNSINPSTKTPNQPPSEGRKRDSLSIILNEGNGTLTLIFDKSRKSGPESTTRFPQMRGKKGDGRAIPKVPRKKTARSRFAGKEPVDLRSMEKEKKSASV